MARIPMTHRLLIAVGYVLGVALYSWLPEQIPPSQVVGAQIWWLGRPMVAFLLPTAAAVNYVLLRDLGIKHRADDPNPDGLVETYDAIMLPLVTFIIGVHAMVLLGAAGVLAGREWADQVVPVMLGVTLMAIGNLLPRTRPNLAIGLHLARLRSDRALWIRAHRLVGYLLVASGLVIELAAVMVPAPFGPAMILAVGPVALGTLLMLTRHTRARAGA